MTLSLSTPLRSQGTFTVSQVVTAIVSQSPRTQYTDVEVRWIVVLTRNWCTAFGFNHDLVLSQMMHETNWLRFTGDVQFGQHNFAGLGAIGGVPGHSFPLENGLIQDDGIKAGVLAVVAHHAAYHWGSKENWPEGLREFAGEHVDPRYNEVLSTGNAGKMHVLDDYRGTWAVPGLLYPEGLISRSKAIESFPREDGQSMSAQISGFVWVPADDHHHRKGRTAKVRGGAQHYSAGTNSLGWLTTDSPGSLPPPAGPVSAHFLVKHSPTMSDRGWQMVDIRDTAWTTSEANPYTVAIEYEHAGGPVPEQAYPVLAQTWIDVAAKVLELGIGEIPLVRIRQGADGMEGLGGHREWVVTGTVCPDGIDMDRLLDEINRRLGADPEPTPPILGTTVPDPWEGSNPWTQGKSAYWIPDLFVEWINEHGFMTMGYVISEAFEEGGLIVQYFERGRLELHPGQQVMAGHTGREAMWARYPDRRVA